MNVQPRRRLAAILVADVVGFSRMMERDETTTFARMRACRRDVIDPTVRAHGGRIVKGTGDGVLAEFASVVAAVSAAIRIQQAVHREDPSSEMSDEGEDFMLRIGVNVGDLIVENGDIFGDGVNVAARLEAMADPGGICISGAALEQITGKVPAEFTPMGEHQLRNVARPIEVYSLGPDAIRGVARSAAPFVRFGRLRAWRAAATALAAAAVIGLSAAALDRFVFTSEAPADSAQLTNAGGRDPEQADKRQPLSILVLPFGNLSGDPSGDYFVDGLTEDLTTDLSRIHGSLVIARNTAFTYKGKPVDVKAVGRELGVRYVVEGSVRRTNDMMRVNVQLIDTETGSHLWAERFDAQVSRLLELSDQVVSRIARSLDLQLIEAESQRSSAGSDSDATDLAMRGWAILNRPRTRDTTLGAADLFQQALTIDPDNVRAGLGLARASYFLLTQRLVDNPALLLERAETLARRAVALEPSSGLAHNVLSDVLVGKKQLDEALAEMRKAVQINRNDAGAWGSIGYQLVLLGRFEEALEPLQHAIEISPRDPSLWVWRMWIGLRALALGKEQEALRWVRSAAETNSQVYPLYLYYTGVAGLLDVPEAQAALETMRRLRPDASLSRVRAETPSDNPRYLALRDRILEGLRKAGLPE